MKRAMFDIETMSTRPNALVISIGGCKFDTDTQEISDEFLLNIDFKDAMSRFPNQFHIDPKTIEWWKSQDRAVLASAMVDQKPLDEAVEQLYSWFVPKQEVWCWGLSFDVPIMETAFRAVGKTEYPWVFWNQRCARTLGGIFGMKPERDPNSHHNALDDSIAQAKLVMEILK